MVRKIIQRFPGLRLKLRSLRMWLRYRAWGFNHVDLTANFLGSSKISRDIVVGPFSSIGPGAWIGPKVSIGKYVMIAPNLTVAGDDHRFDVVGTPTIFSGRPELRSTEIGDDVWIGQNVSIRAGVVIGRGAVIGMGSVVTKNIEPYAIAVGVPAKQIGERFDEDARLVHDEMLFKPAQMGQYCDTKK